jgi:Spy/CpxP family protein refolding chaperone
MNTWKIILATLVIFAAGVMTGGLLVSHSNRANARQMRRMADALESWHPRGRDIVNPGQRAMPPLLERQRMEFILKVHRELKLTPQQRERIEKIVGEGQEKTKTLWEKVAPELQSEMREVREKIRAELTPEQRAKFEKLLKQHPLRGPEPPPSSGRGPRDTPGTAEAPPPPANPTPTDN